MRIERAISGITTLGPGSRLGIWTNGCNRSCIGCVSSRLQKINSTTEVNIESFFDRFDLSNCDGVTISGGEPFLQENELLHLLKYLRKRGIKDILVYTGFLFEELTSPVAKECFSYISVLIDGPYREKEDDDLNNLKGSKNQKIYYFDPSIKNKYESYIKNERHVEEYQIQNILIGIGIPTHDYIKEFQKGGVNEKR